MLLLFGESKTRPARGLADRLEVVVPAADCFRSVKTLNPGEKTLFTAEWSGKLTPGQGMVLYPATFALIAYARQSEPLLINLVSKAQSIKPSQP